MPMLPFGVGYSHWWELPQQPMIFQILHYITFIFGPVIFVSQIVYLYLYHTEYTFIYLGKMFTVIMITFMAVVRYITYKHQHYKNSNRCLLVYEIKLVSQRKILIYLILLIDIH